MASPEQHPSAVPVGFDAALGTGRGTAENAQEHQRRITPPEPELEHVGGAHAGVLLDLLATGDKAIMEIKALRNATSGAGLKWAKDVRDRVARGERLQITAAEAPDPIQILEEAGWKVRYSNDGEGRARLLVSVPAEHRDALLVWLSEHDGREVEKRL